MVVPKEYKAEILNLKGWLKTQSHLPQTIDNKFLEKFLHVCRGDLSHAKALIMQNFTFRNLHGNIFLKRDPCDDSSRRVLQATDMIVIPGLTKDGCKLLLYRIHDTDPDKFNFSDAIRMFFMLADVRFITPDSYGPAVAEIPIFDMAGYSLRHLTKVSLLSLRIFMKFIHEAHPVILKEIHIINCPVFLDKILMVFKPFIKSDIFKLIKFHVPGSDTLYKSIPKEMLPSDYGGNSEKVHTLKHIWINIMNEKRDYLMHEKYWKTHESTKNINQHFSNLNID